MDGSVWTGLFILVLVVGGIWLGLNISKSKGKKLRKKILELAREKGAEVVESEEWPDNIVGIDKESKLLFIAQYKNKAIETGSLQLNDVKECLLVTEFDEKTNFEKILLRFSNKQPKVNADIFCFYDSQFDNAFERNEFQKRAEKWRDRVNKSIK